MAHRPAVRERNAWFLWFVLAIATVSGSFVALALVTFAAISEGEAAEKAPLPLAPGETPLPEVRAGLTYTGVLPPAARGLELLPMAAGKDADIEFLSGGEGAIATSYFVPVVALGTAVEALTPRQLADIMTGEIEDWDEVGGLPGKVRMVVPSPDDLPVYAEWIVPPTGDSLIALDTVDGYEALRAAMTFDSGIIAIIPLAELRPNMVAVAIDGVDIARGIGDPALWPLAERIAVTGRSAKGREQVEAIKANIAAPMPVITRVVATGDILQSRCALTRIEATGDWAAALRGPVAEYLTAAHLALSSLDGSIQDIGEPYGCIDTTNLTSPPEVIEALTVAGIDAMTVATNHAFDCGDAGCGSRAMLQSIARLNAVGIKTVGGGNNLEEALAPAIFEINGVRFGILGFDDIAAEDLEATDTEPGTAPLDDSYENERADLPAEPAFYKPAALLGVTRLQERIRALKLQVDVVVVQIQSGTENTHTPSPRSIKALRAAADAGADLVVGNQAHWVQAAEMRGGSFIAYALGNFVFDQTHVPEHTQGYLLEATFHGKLLATVRMVPYQIEDKYRPVFVHGETRTKIIGDVLEAAADLPR